MAAIFISYRREDSAGYAGRLHEELAGRLGADQVFRDVDTLQAGQDFDAAIRQRVRGCHACVVMIGPGWLQAQTADGRRRLHEPGDYVCMEIAAALARPEVLVVPVLVGGAPMPRAEDLPEAIKPLARRHAMSVRDETWEADIDRVVAALHQAGVLPSSARVSGRQPPASATAARRTPLALAGAAFVVILALIWWATAGGDAGRTRTEGDASGAAAAIAAPAAGGDGVRTGADGTAPGPASAIDVPAAGAEIAHGDLVFAILTGSVQPRGERMRVWLRVRVSNEGFYSANVWDAGFALVSGGETVPSSAGLNEVLERRSLRQYVVHFDAPRASSATLRVTHNGESADLPLDLTPNGSPPKHEETDPRDALSHAAFSSLRSEEVPLVTHGELATSAMRMTLRRFVNKKRLTVVVRWQNNDARSPRGTFDLQMRLAASGEVRAPVRQPSEVVDARATHIGDVVFELPADATAGTLSAEIAGTTASMPLQF